MKKSIILSLFLVSGMQASDSFVEKMELVFGQYGKSFGYLDVVSNREMTVSSSMIGAMSHLKRDMERVCISEGGNLYTKSIDDFGDSIEVAAFDENKLSALTMDQKKKAVLLNSDKKYFVTRDEMEELYSKERVKKGVFKLMDEDRFLDQKNIYNTRCKDVSTGETIYTTKQEFGAGGALSFEVFRDVELKPIEKKSVVAPELETYFADYIKMKKEDKFILSMFSRSKYSEMTQDYCKAAGGRFMLNGVEYRGNAGDNINFESVACLDIDKPFMIENMGTKGCLLSKNKTPEVSKGTALGRASALGQTDVFAKTAVMASTLPVGADSENNVGNIKMVATPYMDFGSYKLVNVREIGGNNTYKNYRVIAGKAEDITARGVSFRTIIVPETVKNAQRSLGKQCVLYGASSASIDGYTVSCTRQSFGSNCAANMITIKGDQFISKESMTCN